MPGPRKFALPKFAQMTEVQRRNIGYDTPMARDAQAEMRRQARTPLSQQPVRFLPPVTPGRRGMQVVVDRNPDTGIADIMRDPRSIPADHPGVLSEAERLRASRDSVASRNAFPADGADPRTAPRMVNVPDDALMAAIREDLPAVERYRLFQNRPARTEMVMEDEPVAPRRSRARRR